MQQPRRGEESRHERLHHLEDADTKPAKGSDERQEELPRPARYIQEEVRLRGLVERQTDIQVERQPRVWVARVVRNLVQSLDGVGGGHQKFPISSSCKTYRRATTLAAVTISATSSSVKIPDCTAASSRSK